MNEDLDKYAAAYAESSPYRWDDILLLGAYAAKIKQALSGRRRLRILSLGIGRQIVSTALLGQLDIDSYQVVEGSAAIIARYVREVQLPPFVQIRQGYFETVSLEGEFDFIEMGFVLEHVDDPGLILRRYRDLLREDGLLFVGVPNARSLHRLLGRAAGLMPDIYALSQADRALGHKRYFDRQTILDLIESSGYEAIAEYGLMLKPFTTGQIKQVDPDGRLDRALVDIGYEFPDIANGILIVARKT